MLEILLIIVTILFAVNLGGSNFAVSFAAAYGGKILNKRQSLILFTLFVILGSVCLGGPVSNTIGNRLLPEGILTIQSVIIVLFASTISLLIGNLLRVPQSSSFVTISSILGVGAFHGIFNYRPFLWLIPAWFFLPLIAYLLTYFIGKFFYPPRRQNFWIYERFVNHQGRLKWFVILTACYNAFSVGANNVANAVGPIAGAGLLDMLLGLLLISPFLGLGGGFFHRALDSTGTKIVPIGLFTATLVSFICGTIMLIASALGIPQSLVVIKMACLMSVSSVKEGSGVTFQKSEVQKTILTWLITPAIALGIAFLLMFLLFK